MMGGRTKRLGRTACLIVACVIAVVALVWSLPLVIQDTPPQDPTLSSGELGKDLSAELQTIQQASGLQPQVSIQGFLEDKIIVTDHEDFTWQTIGDVGPAFQSYYDYLLIGAGESLLMQGRFLYETGTFFIKGGEEPASYRQLIKMDLETGDRTVVESYAVTSEDRPFVYLAKVDETRFLTSEINAETSIVKLHDSTTDTFEELIVYTHERVDGTIQGRLIMDACVSNGCIFLLISDSWEDLTYSIDVYDGSGVYQQTIECEGIDQLMADSAPLGFYALGDYILVSNWNFEHGVYHLKDGALTTIVSPEDKLTFYAGGMDNYYSSSSNHYIYFLRNRVDPPESTLYVFDIRTSQTSQITLNDPRPGQTLTSYYVDEHGNMMLLWQDVEAPFTEHPLYVQRTDIERILGHRS